MTRASLPPPFARILTASTEGDESFSETRDNGQVQTGVCSKTKGGRVVDVAAVAARPGRGAGCCVRRHRRPGRGASLILGDRGRVPADGLMPRNKGERRAV